MQQNNYFFVTGRLKMASYYPINLIPVLKGSDTYSLIITTTKLPPPQLRSMIMDPAMIVMKLPPPEPTAA